jgi:hypothetical protein
MRRYFPLTFSSIVTSSPATHEPQPAHRAVATRRERTRPRVVRAVPELHELSHLAAPRLARACAVILADNAARAAARTASMAFVDSDLRALHARAFTHQSLSLVVVRARLLKANRLSVKELQISHAGAASVLVKIGLRSPTTATMLERDEPSLHHFNAYFALPWCTPFRGWLAQARSYICSVHLPRRSKRRPTDVLQGILRCIKLIHRQAIKPRCGEFETSLKIVHERTVHGFSSAICSSTLHERALTKITLCLKPADENSALSIGLFAVSNCDLQPIYLPSQGFAPCKTR